MSKSTLISVALPLAKTTKFLEIGVGALLRSRQLFSAAFPGRSAVVVADSNTFPIARYVMESLQPAKRFVFEDPDLYAEHRFVKRLTESLANHDAIPIAVGSGTINDITKLAAYRTGRQYMAVATAASMDGYTAFGASITHEGSKQTFDCPAPRAVLAELLVITSAPIGMNAWGYADLLAKMTAGADWIIADELGVEPINPRAWLMVQDSVRRWTGNPAGVRKGDGATIQNLVEGLMMSGFAMQATESSRPASGAEHQFSHLWDMQHATDASHGAKVGVAMVAVAKLYESLARQPLDAMDVDAIVEHWPEPQQIETSIEKLFHPEQALVDKAKLETRAKHPSKQQLREQLNLLQQRWPQLCQRIREHLHSADQLVRMLDRAGAPTTPEQIGLSRQQLRDSFIRAYHIRRRFTVLDLAVRTGTLEACLDEIFS